MLTLLDKHFFDYNFHRLNLGWQFESCVAVCSRILEHDDFLKTYWYRISQGRVATHLRGGGIFSYHFIGNLLQSLTMKEFCKSVKI